jgi:hypothetical protein
MSCTSSESGPKACPGDVGGGDADAQHIGVVVGSKLLVIDDHARKVELIIVSPRCGGKRFVICRSRFARSIGQRVRKRFAQSRHIGFVREVIGARHAVSCGRQQLLPLFAVVAVGYFARVEGFL